MFRVISIFLCSCVQVCANTPNFSGSVPSLVVKTSSQDEYVYFPQTLVWSIDHARGRHMLLLSYQTDSDALHEDGWTGNTWGSGDIGRTWQQVAMPHAPWLFKSCVNRSTAMMCFEYPIRAPHSGFGNQTIGVLRAQIYDGTNQIGTTTATIRFPASKPMYEWGGDTYLMVTDGAVLPLHDNNTLAMLVYGNYKRDGRSGTNYSIVAITSNDGGLSWNWMGTVSHDPLGPCAGPSEHDCVRLAANGNIFCVFRTVHESTLCSVQSADDGLSWTNAVPLNASTAAPNATAPWGVEPKIVQLAGSGRVVISTGRPGIFLWASGVHFTGDDSVGGWTGFNLAAHHNARYSNTALHYHDVIPSTKETTSYTGLVTIPGTEDVLVSYDRLANGWNPAPWPSAASAIFVVRITVSGETTL
eukprot:m.206241 g.206241  ORF g.206241 m.206241 type:complete len:414 (+) comp18895_c0_seq2:210-1451(+)